jgi:hypothetical protein
MNISGVRSIMLAVSLLVALSATAESQTYVSLGYGGVPCNAWTSGKPIEVRVYEAWMLGFISSYNAYVFKGPNIVEGTEVNDLRTWVDRYCKEKPQQSLDAAVRLLIEEYPKKNQ